MLAMAEELGGHDELFWEDDSWAFPLLAVEENDGGGSMLTNIGDPDLRQKGKNVEEEVVPPPAPAKGKKRKAAGGASVDLKNEKKCGGGKREEGKSGGCDEGGGGKGDDGGCGGDEHEQHIWIERERRKKMRAMFSNLHSLIPHLPPKQSDKATIVDEAVEYIQKLEQTLEKLEKQKAQMFKGKTSMITTSCDITSINITRDTKLPIQTREAFLADQGPTSKAHVALANPNSLFSALPVVFKTWISPNVILNVYGEDAHINICCPKKPGLLTGICFVLEMYKIEVVSAQVSSDIHRCMCMMHARASGPVVQFPGPLFVVEEIFKQAALEIMLWVQTKCV